MARELALTNGPIPRLIRQIAVPASIGYFFNTMYNVVDTYFGGTISTQALAALSLTFPVFFIVMAVGSGLSTGATALIGSAIGAEDREEAALLAKQTLSFGLLTALILTIFGILVSPFLFKILGASEEYLTYCLKYMNVIFTGAVFFIMNYTFNATLNALGDTRTFRDFLIFGFILNVIFDPWFIFGGLGLPALGFQGIALATVVIQAIGSFYLGWRVHNTGLISLENLRDFLPRARVYRDILRQGFPAGVNFATIGVGIFVITYFVSQYGQEGVAAYGAAMRIEQIALLPSIGLNVSTLTIVAQNHGAGKYDRIREAIATALKYGGVMMAVGGILVLLLSRPLMSLFTDDPAVIDIGATYLKIDALVLYAYVILFVHVAALQGVKRPMYAVWIGMYRQVAAPVVIFYLLGTVLGLKLLGIWWGIFLITWSAAIFTFFFARRTLDGISTPPA